MRTISFTTRMLFRRQIVGPIVVSLAFLGTVATPTSRTDAEERIAPPAAIAMTLQLQESDWILQAEALHYLSQHRVESAYTAVQALVVDSETHSWLRARALTTLARIDGARAETQILKLSGTKDGQLRQALAQALEYVPTKLVQGATAELLQELLADESAAVQYRALAALARHQQQRAWTDVDAMTGSLGGEHVQWGVRALAFVGTAAALQRIQEQVERNNRVGDIVLGIQEIDNPALVPIIHKMLSRLNPADQQFTLGIDTLRNFAAQTVRESLVQSLQEPDAQSVRAAAHVVSQLAAYPDVGDQLRLAAVDLEDTQTVRAVLLALRPPTMEPDRHRELFTRHLQHRDVQTRVLAISCLANCHQVNLYEVLADCLRDDSPQVIQAALNSLRRSIQSAPPGELVNLLQVPLTHEQEEVRKAAFDLLGFAGAAADFAPALALLSEHLTGSDDEMRQDVAAAFENFATAEQIASIAQRQGYLARWKVVGTFLNDKENKGFATRYPPEVEINFGDRYTAKYVWTLEGRPRDNNGELEREIGWRDALVNRTNGQLVVPPLVPPPAGLAVAYAVADFQLPTTRKVTLTIDGDDAFRVWLNGNQLTEKVATYRHRSPCVTEHKNLEVTLKAGPNRIIVKTANIDFDWWFRLRITDANGLPVEVQP